MLQFKYPEIGDREWLWPILSSTGNQGSESAFGTLFIWKNTYFSKVCRYRDYTLFCFGGDFHTYNYPFGGDLHTIIDLLIEDAKEKKIPFQMWGLSKEQCDRLQSAFPGRFLCESDRNSADYIYRTIDLIDLSGRKYHGKRNHLAQFDRDYQWTYEDISEENLDDCREIAEEWCRTHGCTDHRGFESEPCALRRSLKYFQPLKLGGGLIRIEGKPVAFTIGEEINPTTYLLHFEKALDGYNGLYAAINHEFAARRLSSYEYVNREEDMGIEGLRKAKLSYRPAILLEKYRVTLREDGDRI